MTIPSFIGLLLVILVVLKVVKACFKVVTLALAVALALFILSQFIPYLQ